MAAKAIAAAPDRSTFLVSFIKDFERIPLIIYTDNAKMLKVEGAVAITLARELK